VEGEGKDNVQDLPWTGPVEAHDWWMVPLCTLEDLPGYLHVIEPLQSAELQQ